MKMPFLDGAQSLYFQSGKERSVDFALSFSERSARPFVLRLTGGCAKMTAADAVGMRNLTDALRGKARDSKLLPQFAGFALFGGTRMLSIHDPKVVVPGITEIFPTIAPECPGTVMLGIVPNFRNIYRSHDPHLSDKLILSVEQDKAVVTIVHPELHAVLFLQPTPDREEPWDDEFKECFKYVRALHEREWQALLVVYNGGSVTRKELLLWAEWGLREPGRWPVLIINGSGRTADEYASNREFLASHPDVHVADNTVESINAALFQLGALVKRENEQDDSLGKIIQLRRAC